MEFYLTENIFLKENKTYYIEDGKVKKINNNNWHIYLKEFGWNKLPLPLIKILNKMNKTKNSQFGVLDCNSDGDCLFHCISNAINESKRLNHEIENIDSSFIRNLLAESITEETFNEIIKYYQIMKDCDDFDEEWEPYEIKDLKSFQNIIKKGGHNYWCDYLLLSKLIDVLKLNILIINSNDSIKDYSIYNTMIDYNPLYETIFLLYEDQCHFKLLGYFNDNNMISCFSENIPREFLKLFKIR